MVVVQRAENEYVVYDNGENVGRVVLSHNPHHKTNCYVKLELNCLVPELSRELFAKLGEIAGCPLQVMAESEDAGLAAFLAAGGCICRRRCYEAEVGIEDYIGEIGDTPLRWVGAGAPEYEQACRQMYGYYVATHEKINPWTGTYEDFCRELPETVFYTECVSEILACAFVEDNEIAYVCGKNREHFKEFAQTLVPFLLSQHETVCFESDDCDWAAMTLRGLFQNLSASSYDAYVYGNEGAHF